MADKYINKIKFSDKYHLLDSGANHDSNHILSGTTGDFKVDGDFFANNGVFNYIKAIDGDITNLTVDQLKAKRATVTMRLDVEGELHTNSWTASNISTIEGAFYITPTISCESGTFTYNGTSITVTAATGYSFAINDLYMNGLEGGSGLTSTWWTQYSYVLITGDVLDATINEWKPLGTIKGRIKSNPATTTSIEINELTDSKGSSTVLTLNDIGIGSNKTFRNIKISLYKRATSSTVDYPIGIYMTAMGNKGKTFLDIYGGDNQTGINVTNTIDGVTHSSGALAKPKVRIGNLLGLPQVGGINPTGWGIYTNNGFFSGTIVAQKGQIGNGATSWTIGSGSGTGSVSYIYAPTSGPTSKTADVVGMYVGTDGINNFNSSSQYVRIYDGKIYAQGADIQGAITAISGSIGSDVTIGGTAASTVLSNISSAANTANNYIAYITATDGIKVASSNPSTTTTNYIQITSTGVKTVFDQYNYSLLDSNGLHIYQGTSSAQKVATFSAITAGYVKTTIGNKTENNCVIEGGSLTPARIFFNTGNTERGRITSYETSGGLTIAGFGRTSITSCGSDINEIKSEVVCSSTQVTIGVGNTTYQELYCTGNINIASGSVYKINGNPLTASDVGAVPTSRTVNSKALSSDISLTASDVGAVPTTRTVNSKALSSNISLTASDVGAVPTTRTVNSKALSSDISLIASDVSAVPTSDVSTTGGNNKVIKSDSSGNITVTGSYYTTSSLLSLGTCIVGGYMTNNSGSILFSIPTGRVYPTGTTINKISFNIVARAGNSNSTGTYIIKSSSGGSSPASFSSTTSSTFYNGANVSKTLTTAMWRTKELHGGTNIYLVLGTDDTSSYFFGSSSINSQINNQPLGIYLGDIQVTFNIPT